MTKSKFSVNQIDVDALSVDPTMQANLAQYIVPSYTTAGIPPNPVLGGLIYDTDTDELKVYDAGWNAIGGAPSPTGVIQDTWSLVNGSYDNISFNFQLAGGPSGHTEGLFMDPTGTHMVLFYVDDFYMYTLSTEWDITTASLANSKLNLGPHTVYGGIFIKPDGLKMYLMNRSEQRIYQYTLGTAWDISTATYDSVDFYVGVYEGRGITISPDGKTIFTVGGNVDVIYQTKLATAWDLSTASYASQFIDTTAEFPGISDITASPDGRRIFLTSHSQDAIASYTLATPWEIKSATYDDIELSIAGELDQPHALFIKPDGLTGYAAGILGASMYQYTLNDNLIVQEATTTTAGISREATALEVRDGGISYAYVSPEALNVWKAESLPVSQWSSDGWSVATALFDIKVRMVDMDEAASAIGGQDLCWSDDGLNLYMADAPIGADSVYQFVMDTAWDIETIIDVKSYAVTAITDSSGIFVQPGGAKMWVLEGNSDQVHEYTMGTNYDVTTSTAGSIYTLNPTIGISSSLTFKPDGTKFWVMDLTATTVHEYICDTAWSVASVTNPSNSGILDAAPLSQTTGMTFSPDGKRLLVVDAQFDSMFSHTLGTAWDISTVVYDNIAHDMSPDGVSSAQGIFAKPDGTKVWVSNLGSDVYQYDIRGTTSIDLTIDELSDVVIDTPLTNDLISYDGTNWVNGPLSGAGEAYVDILSSGTLPSAGGTDCIAIGANASTNSEPNSIAIGTNADAARSTAIAIGNDAGPFAATTSTNSIAFGDEAKVRGAFDISIGRKATSEDGSGNVVIGNTTRAKAGSTSCIAIGGFTQTNAIRQISIGSDVDSTSITTDGGTDVAYSVKIGYGDAPTADFNLLHLHSKGKLELLGDEAQFVIPTYAVGGSPTNYPSNSVEGGLVFDSVNNILRVYDGASWGDVAPAGGGGLADGWMHLDNGTTLTTPPVGTGANAIAIGNAVDTGTATKNIGIGESITMTDGLYNAIAIGQTITQTSFNSICIGDQVGVTSSFGVAIGFQSTAAGDSICIGDNADAPANDSIAIGHNAQSGAGLLKSIAIGRGVANSVTFQTRIGDTITASSPGIENVAYEFIAGSGANDVNLNLLDLYGKGKLKLLGDEAQYIFPTYAVGGSPNNFPANSVEGGTIFDSVNNVLKVYDGASWGNVAPASKPQFESITPTGSPPSEIINTTVATVAIGGNPQVAGVQVFRNGMLQDEGVDIGSPATITEDFVVSGANQITFAPSILKAGDKIKIFAFT